MFDIDAILAEEERVVCVFAVDAADLGHLDSTGQHDIDMAAGSRVARYNMHIWNNSPRSLNVLGRAATLDDTSCCR
jgi:hypothetical protein